MSLKKKTLRRHFSILPIDDRLIPDIFSFSHVRGVARMFLVVEITLSTLVVIGTLILIILDTVSL